MRKLPILCAILCLSLVPFAISEEYVEASNEVDLSYIEIQEKKEVRIWSDKKEVVESGEIITLYSELIGFSGEEIIKYQWQYLQDTWIDIEGATSSTYSFPASIDSLKHTYRLKISWE